jgi:tetratricopeptide (TPR) repeat protein
MPNKKTYFKLLKLNVILIILSVFGCMSWQAGWEQFEQPSMKGDVSSLLEKANKQIEKADNRQKVLGVIRTYDNVLKIDPKNREALLGLGSYCFLLGYGYADNSDEKEEYLLKSIMHSEQLMYENPDFKALVDDGEPVWDACRVLSKNEIEAMYWWYNSCGIYWKECRSGLGRLINISFVFRGQKVLTRMMEIDSKWGGGIPYYSWANFYAVAPGLFGGDMEKADEYYKKAIELGPDMLNFRRTRALFYYTKTGDREAFKEDLNWVLSQDPHKVRHILTYPWNVYYQRNAKDLLDHIDDYF